MSIHLRFFKIGNFFVWIFLSGELFLNINNRQLLMLCY